jgi:hypothetical protein
MKTPIRLDDHLLTDPLAKLITVSGNGLQPAVDLDDSATLLDLMEQFDDSVSGLNWCHPLQS